MVVKALKKGANMVLKAAAIRKVVSKKEVKTSLAYMVKAGTITAKELQSIANDLADLSKKHHGRIKNMVEKEVSSQLKKRGYVKAKKTAKKKSSTKKKSSASKRKSSKKKR